TSSVPVIRSSSSRYSNRSAAGGSSRSSQRAPRRSKGRRRGRVSSWRSETRRSPGSCGTAKWIAPSTTAGSAARAVTRGTTIASVPVASIGAVRFPIVLFDLDGTLIDSGAMIVASMRHAATTVLGREIPDEELKAAVGGPGLVAQMRALDETRVDELVEVYRAHNEPLHESLEPCAGIDTALTTLQEQGRRLGIVTAK